MKVARSGLALLFLAASTSRAGEVPDPLFWATEADFLQQVEEGQFVDRLELHLVQYAADPSWRSEWAARRYSGNGLFGEFGSTTGTELYLNSGIALNLFPSERIQFRYDRREYQEGRFDVSDQRFDVAWHAGAGWGVVLSGWPAFDKENSSLGLGVRIGAPRSRNGLELRVVDEHFVWNEKTDGNVRFTRRPIRILADGYRESGRWRVYGSVDLGLEYAAEETAAAEAAAERVTRGFQRFADVEAEYAAAGWTAGLRVTGASLERSQSERTGPEMSLERSWGRATVSFRRDFGNWTVSALAGWSSQRDETSSPSDPAGTYSLDAFLLGVEGGVRATRNLRLRLGYLGSSQQAERTASESGPLPARQDDAYLDKAHVRAIYDFKPQMSIELLLSQALRGGSFGGGSIKAILVF